VMLQWAMNASNVKRRSNVFVYLSVGLGSPILSP
jgi:hypothetical protein